MMNFYIEIRRVWSDQNVNWVFTLSGNGFHDYHSIFTVPLPFGNPVKDNFTLNILLS